MCDEMERSIHDALCVVKRVLESKSVVPGGGAVEAALSIYLENYATSMVSLAQRSNGVYVLDLHNESPSVYFHLQEVISVVHENLIILQNLRWLFNMEGYGLIISLIIRLYGSLTQHRFCM